MCNFYADGKCNKGNSCPYIHELRFEVSEYLGKKISRPSSQAEGYDLFPFQISYMDLVKRCVTDCTSMLHNLVVYIMRVSKHPFLYRDYADKSIRKVYTTIEEFEASPYAQDASSIISYLITKRAVAPMNLPNDVAQFYINTLKELKVQRHRAAHGFQDSKVAKEVAEQIIATYEQLIDILTVNPEAPYFSEVCTHRRAAVEFRITNDDLVKFNQIKSWKKNYTLEQKKKAIGNSLKEIVRNINEGGSEEFINQIFHDICLRMPSLLIE